MKILASDLDGTLYFGDQPDPIRPQDREAIHAFQKAGNAFGICSGRTLAGIHHALDGRDIDLDFYILVSGAALANREGNTSISTPYLTSSSKPSSRLWIRPMSVCCFAAQKTITA